MGSSSVTGGSSPQLPDSSDDDQLRSESEEDDFVSIEDFPADEQENADTTARQHYEEGKDQQGIPWERLQVRTTLYPCESSNRSNRSAACMGWNAPALCDTRSPLSALDPATTHTLPPVPQHQNAPTQVSREEYRQQRIQRYRNYMNVIPEDECPAVRAELTAGWPQPQALRACPYAFVRNWRTVASSIVHFQLRNLLWAASAHDVAVVYDNRVQHWNSVTRTVSDVLDLRGWPKGPRLPGLTRVQVGVGCTEPTRQPAGHAALVARHVHVYLAGVMLCGSQHGRCCLTGLLWHCWPVVWLCR